MTNLSTDTAPSSTEPAVRRYHQPAVESRLWNPTIQRTETVTGYLFTVTLPGYQPDAVELTLSGDQLTLHIECHGSGSDPSHHTFRRRLNLPPDSSAVGITTRSHDQRIEVQVPRTPLHTVKPARLAS